jgi:hypothetical protein
VIALSAQQVKEMFVKQLRKRITYANVMSSIAVFLVLGGAAVAAGLAKNSVGSKQLKKNAVTTAKLKNNAVTTAKIRNGAVTGAKLNLASVGKVPSATTADTANHANTANSANKADTANSATNAGNANTVAGFTIRKFFYVSEETTNRTTLLELNGLTLTGACEGGTTALIATTSVSDSLIHAGGTFLNPTAFYVEEDSFDTGDEVNLLEEESDSVQGTLTYTQPNGTVVTATFQAEEGFNGSSCAISGHAIG